MTTDTQLAPTDAELWQLHMQMPGRHKDPIDFARAVLAKWGTPAPVGVEPVARLEIGKTKGGVSLTHIAEPAAYQLPEGMYALYTAPQPTQAQYRLLQSGVDRIEAADEFLSDDTTTWAIDQNGIFSGNIYGGHVLRPARRRIKGGQHGTE